MKNSLICGPFYIEIVEIYLTLIDKQLHRICSISTFKIGGIGGKERKGKERRDEGNKGGRIYKRRKQFNKILIQTVLINIYVHYAILPIFHCLDNWKIRD